MRTETNPWMNGDGRMRMPSEGTPDGQNPARVRDVMEHGWEALSDNRRNHVRRTRQGRQIKADY